MIAPPDLIAPPGLIAPLLLPPSTAATDCRQCLPPLVFCSQPPLAAEPSAKSFQKRAEAKAAAEKAAAEAAVAAAGGDEMAIAAAQSNLHAALAHHHKEEAESQREVGRESMCF